MPEQIGGYPLVDQLHEGGEGIVYRARDANGELVVLKVPRQQSQGSVARFLREIAILRQLDQYAVPGVVRVLDAGSDGELPWYVMEWVRGENLASFQKQLWSTAEWQRGAAQGFIASQTVTATVELSDGGVLSADGVALRPSDTASRPSPARIEALLPGPDPEQRFARGLLILRRLADSLAAVHSLGLLHGDLSPGNVMLTEGDEPVLLDFGTQALMSEPGRFRETASLWVKGRGTPGYAAPELLRGEAIDSRCDLYSLGCIAFELLFGRRPFTADNVEDLVRQHLFHTPELPATASEPKQRELAQLVLAMLHKDPMRRVAYAQVVADAARRRLGEPPGSVPANQGHAVLFRPRLRGREANLQQLDEALQRTLAGQGGFGLLEGVSGVGKTRVLNEFAAYAARRRARVIVCRSTQSVELHGTTFRDAGLNVFTPVFEEAANRRTELGADNDAGEAELSFERAIATLAPYAPSQLFGESTLELPELSPAGAKRRLFDALFTLLLCLTGDGGLLLLLDDLQWVDELSAEFLISVAERLQRSRVLLLGTMRTEQVSERCQALQAVAEPRLVLAPLGSDAVSEITKDLIAAEQLPEGLLEFLTQHSEGNPFFVAEYTRAALQKGWLRRDPVEGWRFPSPANWSSSEIGIPETVDELLAERTRRVSRDALSVLQCAAVLGKEFEREELVQLVGDTMLTTRALQELVSSQVLDTTSSGSYRFPHDKLREAQERALAPEECRRLHRMAAERMAHSAGSGSVQYSARLGYHWAAALEPARALPCLQAAAEHARERNALDFAGELYRLALAQAERLEGPRITARRADLNETLGDVLVSRAKHTEARERYDRALQLRSSDEGLAKARLWRKRATSCWTLHDYEQANTALGHAERVLGSPDPEAAVEHWQEWIQIKLGHFEHLYFSGKTGPLIERILNELLPMVERFGTAKQRNTYYIAAASYGMLRRRYLYDDEPLSLALRAVDASDGLPLEQKTLARFVYAFAMGLGTVEQCRESIPWLKMAISEAREIGETTLLSRACTYHALAHLRLGSVESTAQAAEEASLAAEAARLPPYAAAATACRGWVKWRNAETGARALLEQARQIWAAHAHPFPMRWVANFPLLALLLASDDFEAMTPVFDDLLDKGHQALPESLTDAIESSRAIAKAGSPREAARSIEALLRLAQQLGYC